MEAELSVEENQDFACEIYRMIVNIVINLFLQEVKERPRLKTVNLSEFLPPQTASSTVWNMLP